MTNQNNFTPQITADGSFTFFSEDFQELFHSYFGARQESFLKYVIPTQLNLRANQKTLRILDICYGLGYNTAAALETIWHLNPQCHVEVIGLELNTSVPKAAITHNLFSDWHSDCVDILSQLANEQQLQTDRITAKLMIGDARTEIQKVYESGFQADAIFLDPFSPPQCPHLWTIEFINYTSKCLHQKGLLATYSCAAAVRTALITARLQVSSIPPVGKKAPSTVAAHLTLPPLSPSETEHLLTRAAVPYRDPLLQDSPAEILKRRRIEQKASLLESTSVWRKRWSLAKSSIT